MPWYEKDHQTPFEETPINGLAFLHGDVVARQYKEEWVRGKKYPLVTFPSGTSREVLLENDSANIYLFGTLTLPRSSAYDDGVNALLAHAKDYPLQILGDGKRNLVVINRSTRRGYELSYDPNTQELVNLTPLPKHAMELLPGDLRAVLPKLYSTERTGDEAIAPIKFFTPDAHWTWYPTEFDGDDLFFGLVSGNELELGYFSLSELESVQGGLGLPIERDLYFTPQSLKTLRAMHER